MNDFNLEQLRQRFRDEGKAYGNNDVIAFVKDVSCKFVTTFEDYNKMYGDPYNDDGVLFIVFQVEGDDNFYGLDLEVDYYGYFKEEAQRIVLLSFDEVLDIIKSSNKFYQDKLDRANGTIERLESANARDKKEFEKTLEELGNNKLQEIKDYIGEFKYKTNVLISLLLMKEYFKLNSYFHIPRSCGDTRSLAYKLNPHAFFRKGEGKTVEKLLEKIDQEIVKKIEDFGDEAFSSIEDLYPLDYKKD